MGSSFHASRVCGGMGIRVRPSRLFYGWWIVGAGLGLQALATALLFHAFGTYVVLLEREFGWSRAVLAGAFSLARVEDGLLGPAQGWMLDRFGPRAVIRVGVVVLGVGFVLFSRVDSLATFYATFMIMAVGAGLAGFLSITTSIVNWFTRRRALATGLALLGTAVGGFAQPAVVGALEAYGWRDVAVASGVIVIVFGLPLAQLMRHRPEPYGLLPDGLPPDKAAEARSVGGVYDEQVDYTVREAIRTRAFWLISGAHASGVLVVTVVTVHFVPHVNTGLGYSLSTAALLLTLMTTMNLVGRVIGGYLGDRANSRALIIVSLLGHAAALLFLTFAQSLWMVVAFAILNGLAWGARVPVLIALRAEYFGARSYGKIMGFSSLIVMIGSVSGPLLAGLSYDVTGSYTIGFTAVALLAAAGSLLMAATPPPRPIVRPTSPTAGHG